MIAVTAWIVTDVSNNGISNRRSISLLWLPSSPTREAEKIRGNKLDTSPTPVRDPHALSNTPAPLHARRFGVNLCVARETMMPIIRRYLAAAAALACVSTLALFAGALADDYPNRPR